MAVVTEADAGRRAVQLGATMLQLRAPGAHTHVIESAARELLSAGVPLIVSSRCDIVLAAGAAGVNLPEKDIPIADARRLLGPDRLIGRSVHSLDSASAASTDGADYVIFGPIWPTPTHPDSNSLGVDALRQVANALAIPVIAIGGVSRVRIDECLAAGAAGYASIRLFA
jgi:thiamine-phosphate pyrophosphorylase